MRAMVSVSAKSPNDNETPQGFVTVLTSYVNAEQDQPVRNLLQPRRMTSQQVRVSKSLVLTPARTLPARQFPCIGFT